MAIRQWHAGRIGLLWLAAALLTAFFVWVVSRGGDSEAFLLALLGAAFGSVVLAFVVSWIWFGGRERK